jgi:FkbM family methyltransferase
MLTPRHVLRRLVPRPIRNWARAPAKTAQWLADEVRHAVGAHQDLQIRSDWTLRCHPAAYRALRASQVDDPSQAAELAAFVGACRPGMLLFDLGAHFGVFSLAALRYGGYDARSVAVEPSPAAARILQIQSRLNGAAGRVTLVRAAAAGAVGTQAMLAAGVIADGFFVTGDADRPPRELTTVPTVSIDSLARDLGVRPSHIKIDVEGAEVATLEGGRDTLCTEPRPVVFLELHNEIARRAGRDPGEPLDLLAAVGYGALTVGHAPAERAALLAPPIARLVARDRPA